MGIIKRHWWILALVAIVVAGGTYGAIALSGSPAAVPPGHIDDGVNLLPQASITLEQAVSAAQGAAKGEVGEVDLEMYQGKLVFNIDIGDKDIKVDASNGIVLGSVQDDNNAHQEDENVQEPSYTGSIIVDDTQYEGMSDTEQAAALQPLTKISAAEAEAAALRANPGTTTVKVELDNENGVVVYSVELNNGLDVKVDAGTGKILHTEASGPDREDDAQDQQDTED